MARALFVAVLLAVATAAGCVAPAAQGADAGAGEGGALGAGSDAAGAGAAGEARAEGKATLIAHPLVVPTDRLELRFTLPEEYARATVTLTWSATVPTQERLALRVHEKGVLHEGGEMDLLGGAPLVQALHGASPLTWEVTPADLPPGTYDAHVYPDDETRPVVEQPFVLHVAWT